MALSGYMERFDVVGEVDGPFVVGLVLLIFDTYGGPL
jgi:hypothetical protein